MIDAKIEKQITTGAITSSEFLNGLEPLFHSQLQIPFTNRVVSWCVEYYKQYKQAPVKHIEDIFREKRKTIEETEGDLIEEFLDRLSNSYEKDKTVFNTEYVLDNAEKYFRTIAINKLKQKIESTLEKGDITKAENAIKTFERVARPESTGVNPFDTETITKAFNEESGDILFKYPGQLGEVLGYFEREYLMAFLGSRGKGKTWWLLWSGILAMQKGYNVLFVSLEMSEKQIIRRIYQLMCGLPLKKSIVKIPVFEMDGDDIDIEYREEEREGLTTSVAIERVLDLKETSMLRGQFELLCWSSGTRTVEDLKIQLHNMEYYKEFIPDVIITDYADKFKAESSSRMDKRWQIASVWEQHKALAQDRKCLVMTASQSNTARTGKDIGEGSASESMAKEDLCDVIIGLNQKPEEKEKSIMRLSITKHRHDDYDIMREIVVTQCYKIGRPYLDSKVRGIKK